MKWTKTKFDATFNRYVSGDYEIVQLYEPSLDGHSHQLNHNGFYLGAGSVKSLKEFAEEHKKIQLKI